MRKTNKLYGRATVVRSNPHRSYAGGERSTGEMRDPGMQPHSYFFRASVDSTWRCASWATHFLTHTNRRACARMSETRVGHGVSVVSNNATCADAVGPTHPMQRGWHARHESMRATERRQHGSLYTWRYHGYHSIITVTNSRSCILHRDRYAGSRLVHSV